MPLYLTDDQAMLRDTARELHGRGRRDRRSSCATGATPAASDGFGHDLWKQFAEMGFTGILIDEADGGLGLGHVEAGIVLEEIGRNLTPSPFLISAVAFVEALKGTALRGRWYPGILAGETVAALAIDEGAKHRPEAIAMRAERSGNGFSLSGAQAVRRPGRVGGRDPGRRADRRGPDPVRGREGREGPRRRGRAARRIPASARG